MHKIMEKTNNITADILSRGGRGGVGGSGWI